MRVLHVNKYLYRRGGAESYMFDLADLQRQAGHEVDFFGMTHPDNEAQRLAHHFPRQVELEPPPSTALGKASAVARMIWSSSSRRGLAHVLDEVQPDVVHLHNIYHQLSPSILAATSEFGVPTVMTLHDYKLACPSYQMLDHGKVCSACIERGPLQAARHRCKDGALAPSVVLAAESWLHRRMGAYDGVDAFICPSRFLAGTMAAAGVYPGRMHVINHFVDVTGVPVRLSAGSGFAFAGRLSSEKGVDTLITALSAVPEAHLTVVGDGPQRAALEAQAADVAPGRVRFLGRLDRQGVLGVLRRSRAAVVPSRWNENQPMVVLEALASGVPVVTTDLGGLSELIDHGSDGLVVPADDPRALSAALRTMHDEPGRSVEMGARGRQKVERQFSADRHLGQVSHLYATIAHEPKSRRAALHPVEL